MTEALTVSFVWHMHQPLYKDRLSGQYLMPWVRLHAIKDYLDMPLLLNEFPKIRQTFNLVPSLMEQLADYANNAVDSQLLLTVKPIEELTDQDKRTIIITSFYANVDRQINRYQPYATFYERRKKLLDQGLGFWEMLGEFSNQEYADMATWLNLAWFDPSWHQKLPTLSDYLKQGVNFSLQQRQQLIEMQRTLIRQIIPTYRALQEKGLLEITTTPYYHPILPLLIDSNVAKLSNPDCTLPERLFLHKADALHQLKTGLALYQQNFGVPSQGMWPSELAVSPPALEAIAQCGIKWVVLDEALLTKTIGQNLQRDQYGNLDSAEILCQPYLVKVGDSEINVLFREVVLSNEISFSYGHRAPEEAVHAFHQRLKHIQQALLPSKREGIVVIALDGENCWETFEDDGNIFLSQLYEKLSQDNTLKVRTISDYLQEHPATTNLHNLHSGSWIGADFHIWIGDPIKNKAWDLLGKTRDFLIDRLKSNSYPPDIIQQAFEEIYTAEGSDWFWWFGEPNNSSEDPVFDLQFRLRLHNVYKLLGAAPPAELSLPIGN